MKATPKSNEKEIDIENFDSKNDPSSDFSSNKTISGDSWGEDGGPSGTFPPS